MRNTLPPSQRATCPECPARLAWRSKALTALSVTGALLAMSIGRAQEHAVAPVQLSPAKTAQGRVQSGPALSYPKGNGLRMLATGHSWVMPALGTITPIATAAGYSGHQLLFHTNGGDQGSARSIWAAELGLDYPGRKQAPPKPILLPALATGQWDVMTWGLYRWDKPDDYFPWIDACLKANPDMIFYIQDGWPETRDFMTPAGVCDLAALRARQTFINNAVAQLIHTLNAKYPDKVHVIPVGDGICRLVTLLQERKLPFIQQINSQNTTASGIYRDGGHLDEAHSGLGWFEGYIYYATLYRKPPAAIKAAFKVPDAELDKLFRRLAWDVVCQHPLSGLSDQDRQVEPMP